jgi:hypothetical protein
VSRVAGRRAVRRVVIREAFATLLFLPARANYPINVALTEQVAPVSELPLRM